MEQTEFKTSRVMDCIKQGYVCHKNEYKTHIDSGVERSIPVMI
jgi:hypothetical protein